MGPTLWEVKVGACYLMRSSIRDRRPTELPLSIHAAERDPWIDWPVLDGVAKAAPAEVWRYPGSCHLLVDPEDPAFDPALAELMWARVRAFRRR